MNDNVFRSLASQTDSVIVAVSRGKDSLACLDLAKKHFRRVEAFFMYLVPGISFVESYLNYLERRYSIHIERRPHWWLSYAFRFGSFRSIIHECPLVKIKDIRTAERERTGIDWIISGEKACDSIHRRGMLSTIRRTMSDGIDSRVKVCYPLARWSHRHVYDYLKQRNIPLPADYRIFNGSFSCALTDKNIYLLRQHYPEDYLLVEKTFPFVGVAAKRYELRLAEQSSTTGSGDAISATSSQEAAIPCPDDPA